MKKIIYPILLLTFFSCEQSGSKAYLNWKSYLNDSNDYERLLVQIAQIDGLDRKDHNKGSQEEICFGDIDDSFWACVIRFSSSEWNVNLQFTERLKAEYNKNVRNIKATLKYKTKKVERFCNCEVETYFKPSGRFVNVFESISGDGTKKYNIIIEY